MHYLISSVFQCALNAQLLALETRQGLCEQCMQIAPVIVKKLKSLFMFQSSLNAP